MSPTLDPFALEAHLADVHGVPQSDLDRTDSDQQRRYHEAVHSDCIVVLSDLSDHDHTPEEPHA